MKINELIGKILKRLKNETAEYELNLVKVTRKKVLDKSNDEKEVTKNVAVLEIEKIFEKTQVQYEETEQRRTIPDTEMVGNKLLLKLPQVCDVKYFVMSLEEKVKRPMIANNINLESGDRIFLMTYKNREICVNRYQVTDIRAKNNSICKWMGNFCHINQIELCDLPQPVKREIKNFFYLVGKPSQLSQ